MFGLVVAFYRDENCPMQDSYNNRTTKTEFYRERNRTFLQQNPGGAAFYRVSLISDI